MVIKPRLILYLIVKWWLAVHVPNRIVMHVKIFVKSRNPKMTRNNLLRLQILVIFVSCFLLQPLLSFSSLSRSLLTPAVSQKEIFHLRCLLRFRLLWLLLLLLFLSLECIYRDMCRWKICVLSFGCSVFFPVLYFFFCLYISSFLYVVVFVIEHGSDLMGWSIWKRSKFVFLT